MTRSAEPRRAVPMRLQRDRALALCADLMRKLGMVPVDAEVAFELDHDPALCLRPVDPATGEHIPPQHEPSCLIWRTKAQHALKTHGPGGERRITTAGSDRHTRDKGDRLSERQESFRRTVLSKADPDEAPGTGHRYRCPGGLPRNGPQRSATRKSSKSEIAYRPTGARP